MPVVDTHCHLNHAAFAGDRDDVLARAIDSGVWRLLVIGYDLASSRLAVDLAAGDERLGACVGIHPESAGEWDDDTRVALSGMWASGVVRAYGEIGLDYHWESVPRVRQADVFHEQIAFATSLSPSLPLIIHCRDAFDDTLGVIRSAGAPNPVVMHCFTGSVDDARACVDAGCYLGIGGVATFPKSQAVRDAVAWAPLDRLLLETDCPYLAPQPWRGKRNEPAYVAAVARTVAECRGVGVDDIGAATTATACRLFGWPQP